MLLALLLAAGLRGWMPERLAVEHFDEGIYSCDYWIVPITGDRYPLQLMFAPPLFPTLQRLAVESVGLGVPGVFGVSLLAGVLTVGLIGWSAARWFGFRAAVVSVVFAACSDMHVLFSRMALTDSLHLCLFLLSLIAAVETLRSPQPGWGWPILSGCAAGAAFATKYTGWLVLPVVFGTFVALIIVSRRRPGGVLPLVFRLGVLTGCAAVVWWPVWSELQRIGGYSVIRENHQGYFRGPTWWWEGLQSQVVMSSLVESWVGWAGPAVASSLLLVGAMRSTWNTETHPRWLWLGLIAGLVLSCWSGWTVVLLGGWACAAWVAACRIRRGDIELTPLIALVLWGAGMLLAVPMYAPYPRLSLLWLPPVWLLAGWGAARLLEPLSDSTDAVSRGMRAVRVGILPVLAALGILLGGANHDRGTVAWEDRTGIRNGVSRLLQQLETQPQIDLENNLVMTFGEPSAMFHLLAQGTTAVPTAQLGSWLEQPSGALLLVGPHLSESDRKRLDAATKGGRIVECADTVVELGHVVRWNLQGGPLELRSPQPFQLFVYRHVGHSADSSDHVSLAFHVKRSPSSADSRRRLINVMENSSEPSPVRRGNGS